MQTGFCDWSARYFAQPVMKVAMRLQLSVFKARIPQPALPSSPQQVSTGLQSPGLRPGCLNPSALSSRSDPHWLAHCDPQGPWLPPAHVLFRRPGPEPWSGASTGPCRAHWPPVPPSVAVKGTPNSKRNWFHLPAFLSLPV